MHDICGRRRAVAQQHELDAVRRELSRGGDFRPFVASKFSREVGQLIGPDAPLGEFLKPLLNGDYQAAARAAWRQARLAKNGHDHDEWIKAVALAVACQDQYRAGRAAAFLKWRCPITTLETPTRDRCPIL